MLVKKLYIIKLDDLQICTIFIIHPTPTQIYQSKPEVKNPYLLLKVPHSIITQRKDQKNILSNPAIFNHNSTRSKCLVTNFVLKVGNENLYLRVYKINKTALATPSDKDHYSPFQNEQYSTGRYLIVQ